VALAWIKLRALALDPGGRALIIPAMPTSPIGPIRHRRHFLAVLALAVPLAALGLAGCDGDTPREPAFHDQSPADANANEKDIHATIAQLAKGKDPDDPAASAAYDEAKDKLIKMGQTIENDLIDSLRRDHDWGVRLGCIEVLQAVGGKACVEHLIATLLDDVPLVAFQAEKTIEVMTNHKVIPPPGGDIGANGLPPIPARAPNDLAMDAELRIWTAWYGQNKQVLHDTWFEWWKNNKAATKME
jgi:hypothetical protein